jgi:hypothetical protein
MTKSEVTEQIGEPDAVGDSIRNKYGQLLQVWVFVSAIPMCKVVEQRGNDFPGHLD